jgi:thiol peroxidase
MRFWNRLRGRIDLILFSVTLYKIIIMTLLFGHNQKEREAIMNERTGLITMRGNPLTLIGQEIKPGDPAPDFESLDNELKPVRFSSFRGKVVVISAVPSLDTPVCDMETRRFNSEAAKLSDDIIILTISMDLPFAQKRWCGAAGVDKVITLSDHREAEFGNAYGVLIKELRLLARAVFVADAEGVVRYVQLVNEVAKEPDYDAVISAAKKLV